MEYSEDMDEEICFYVRYHDDSISWAFPGEKYDCIKPCLKSIVKGNIVKYV